MKKELLGLFILGSLAIAGCQKDDAATPDAQLSADRLSSKDVLGERDLAGSDTTSSYTIETLRIGVPTTDTDKAKPAKKDKADKAEKNKLK